MPIKIRSGGQRGVDQIALHVARANGLETTGFAPKDFRVFTKEGNTAYDKDLLESFELVATGVSHYMYRTRKNIEFSDGTIIFALTSSTTSKVPLSSGSLATYNLCQQTKKPCLINPGSPKEVIEFVQDFSIKDLNIAGNRETLDPKNTKLLVTTAKLLNRSFNLFKELNL